MEDSPSRRDVAIPSDAEHIRVNVQYPEKNGPLMIFPVPNISGAEKNKFFPGFAIFFEVDIRFAFDSAKDHVEYFSARTFQPNKVLIRVPAWDYCLFANDDREQLVSSLGSLGTGFINAIDAKRNQFKDNKEHRQWRHYVLEFEPYHELSAKAIFADAGDDDTLPRKIIPIKYTHDSMNKKYNVKHYLCLWVARVEQGAEQHGASTNTMTLTATALKDLGGDGGF